MSTWRHTIIQTLEDALERDGWLVRSIRIEAVETGGMRLRARLRHAKSKTDQVVNRELMTRKEERDGALNIGDIYTRALRFFSELEKPREYHVAFRPGRKRYPLGTGVMTVNRNNFQRFERNIGKIVYLEDRKQWGPGA